MEQARYLPIPGFLFLCILLGGASNGGFLTNAVLQLLAIALIVWSQWNAQEAPARPSNKALGWFLIAFATLVALQFFPVPSAIWELSAGRRILLEEAQTIGLEYSPKFFGLLPSEALKSALWMLPAVAIAVAMLRTAHWKEQHVAWAIIAAMVLSVLLGTVQLAQGQNSAAYLYAITNRGSTVGFFANSNHLATLLLISLPMTAALTQRQLRKNSATSSVTIWAIAAALLVIALTGIGVNGSLAGFGLVGPILLASAAILVQNQSYRRISIIIATIIVLVGQALLLFTDAGQELLKLDDVGASSRGREAIWATTWRAIADFLPFGSGLGTFSEVYARYEDSSTVINVYINHAHNEYLELLLEFGILIVPLMGAFLIWWGRRTISIWLAAKRRPFAMAGSVATGIVLVHSIVDYPMRTAAISSIFAASLMIMLAEHRKHKTHSSDTTGFEYKASRG